MNVLLALLLALLPALVAAQSIEGRYYFVSLGANPVRSSSGTLVLKPGHEFEMSGSAADGAAAGQTFDAKGAFAEQDARIRIPQPRAAQSTFDLLPNASATLLAGIPSSTTGIFLAARAPDSGQVVRLKPGRWSGAVLSLDQARPEGLATAFFSFTAAADGSLSPIESISHLAAVDDVNRSGEAAAQSIRAGGQTTLRLTGAAPLAGQRDLFVAAQGELLLASSREPSRRDILIAMRVDPEGSLLLRGSYAFFEFGAENSFAFAPAAARFFSSSGTLQAEGGKGLLRQRVRRGPQEIDFTGRNFHLINSDGVGSFGSRLMPRLRNTVLGAGMFLTAQTGEPGGLSLLHGFGVGLKRPDRDPEFEIHARARITSTDSGPVLSLYGKGFAQGVAVRVGGQEVLLLLASPNQINVRLDEAPKSGPIEVSVAGRPPVKVELGPAALPLDRAAPDGALLFHADGAPVSDTRPAVAGEPLDLILTGVGASAPVDARVLFDGVAAKAQSWGLYAGPNPALAGTLRVNLLVPEALPGSPQTAVAIATGKLFTDLVDIPVRARR